MPGLLAILLTSDKIDFKGKAWPKIVLWIALLFFNNLQPLPVRGLYFPPHGLQAWLLKHEGELCVHS